MSPLTRREFLRASIIASVSLAAASCAQPTPQVIEKEVPVEKIVKETVVVEKQVPVEKIVKETVVVEKEVIVEKQVTVDTGPKEMRMIAGGLTTLDTYLYTSGMYVQCFLGLKEGLVEFDQNFAPHVAQSEGWELSPDGRQYTFKLRKDVTWYDGTPVTAHDYVAAVQNQIAPGRESKYGWDSPFGSLVNANEYRRGAVGPEELGAKAVNDFVLEFTLVNPRPDFINALVTGSCYPLQKASWDEYGDDCFKLENFQGNGPYKITEWVVNESTTLEPNPNYTLPRGNLTKIVVKNAGKPLEAYQADEVDFTGIGAVADLVVAQNDPILSQELDISDTSGLEWLAPVSSEDGFLYDHPEVVKALARGIDYKTIIDAIWMGIKRHTPQMYYPAQPGFDPALDSVLGYDLDVAKKMLADAGFPNGQGVPSLKITFPSYQNQDYVSMWTAIAAAAKENLGLDLVLNNLETGIYSQVVYDPLNPESEAGFGFYASGKPWSTPTFGFDFVSGIRQLKSAAARSEYGKMIKAQQEVRNGLTTVDGGSDDDFKRVIAEVKALRSAALPLYDGHHPEIKASATKLYDSWVEAAEAAQTSAGEDRAKAWQNINANLMDFQNELYLLENRTDEYWQILDWQMEAQLTTDSDRQAELSRMAYEKVLSAGWFIPLLVAQSVKLVKPYVKGLLFNPFWWGTQLYMKWVNLE